MSMEISSLKIALVHDWLLRPGGAERVLKELHKTFPQAPIYTLFYNKDFTDDFLPDAKIIPSFLNKAWGIKRLYQYYTPFMPTVVEQFDLSDYDLVISSSVAFSKGLILKTKTKHICYCHSPARFLWDLAHFRIKESKKYLRWPTAILNHLLRIWDRQAADRVDFFIANSINTQKRIRHYYNKKAQVIYPPVKIKHRIWNLEYGKNKNNYYLVVSQLFKHKNVHFAMEAFRKVNLPLKIVGMGPEFAKLKKETKNMSNIELLGNITDDQLETLYRESKALIVPHHDEDFGITTLEAMSYGKPVLAIRKGGFKETVLEGQTGEFFDSQHPAVIADGVRRIEQKIKADHYNPLAIQRYAEKFSVQNFREKFLWTINFLLNR